MGTLSKLKITAPKKPEVSKSNRENVIDGSQSQRISKSNIHNQEMLSSQSPDETVIIETVKGSYEYKVKGYSLAKGIGIGKFMASGKFTVGGYDWDIQFYPDGQQANQEHVCLYLRLLSPGEVRASLQFELLDQSGKGIPSYNNSSKSPSTFNTQCSSWGRKKYMKKTVLETSTYLKDDCLNIRCTVGVLQTRVEKKKHYAIHVPPSDMIQNLKDLLKSESGYDITFQVGNECFRAHKSILAARSPVFRAMFSGSVGNPNMETEVIKEFDPFAFKAMLLFLYSDELPEARELSDSHYVCTSTTLMQHLLAAADHFALARLKLMCEAKLGEEITADTVAATLALAEQHQFLQLKTVCLNFAAKPENLREVIKSDGYAYLETICPSLLADLLETCAVINIR